MNHDIVNQYIFTDYFYNINLHRVLYLDSLLHVPGLHLHFYIICESSLDMMPDFLSLLSTDLALSLNIMLATSVGYLNKYGCALNFEYFRVFVFGIFLHSCRRYSNAFLTIASFIICFHLLFVLNLYHYLYIDLAVRLELISKMAELQCCELSVGAKTHSTLMFKFQ